MGKLLWRLGHKEISAAGVATTHHRHIFPLRRGEIIGFDQGLKVFALAPGGLAVHRHRVGGQPHPQNVRIRGDVPARDLVQAVGAVISGALVRAGGVAAAAAGRGFHPRRPVQIVLLLVSHQLHA